MHSKISFIQKQLKKINTQQDFFDKVLFEVLNILSSSQERGISAADQARVEIIVERLGPRFQNFQNLDEIRKWTLDKLRRKKKLTSRDTFNVYLMSIVNFIQMQQKLLFEEEQYFMKELRSIQSEDMSKVDISEDTSFLPSYYSLNDLEELEDKTIDELHDMLFELKQKANTNDMRMSYIVHLLYQDKTQQVSQKDRNKIFQLVGVLNKDKNYRKFSTQEDVLQKVDEELLKRYKVGQTFDDKKQHELYVFKGRFDYLLILIYFYLQFQKKVLKNKIIVVQSQIEKQRDFLRDAVFRPQMFDQSGSSKTINSSPTTMNEIDDLYSALKKNSKFFDFTRPSVQEENNSNTKDVEDHEWDIY